MAILETVTTAVSVSHPLLLQLMIPIFIMYVLKQVWNFVRNIYKTAKSHDSTYLSVVRSFLQEALDKCPDANRVSFFEFSNGNFTKLYKSLDKINIRQEVIKGDVDPMINILTDMNRSMIESWEAQWINAGGINDVMIIKDTKDELDNTIRRVLEQQGIMSIAVCPVYYKKRIIGFLAIDLCFTELKPDCDMKLRNILKETKMKVERELRRI